MKDIQLTKGKVALVDDDMFEELNQFKWYVNNNGYAVRRKRIPEGRRKTCLMHRFIMNTPPDMQTDHKDRNRLNNQKSNLRLCTPVQNSQNKGTQSGNYFSKFKGVTIKVKNKKYKCYVSQISINGKRKRKNFPFTPEGELHAASWYNETAKKHFGSFACLNSLPSSPKKSLVFFNQREECR